MIQRALVRLAAVARRESRESLVWLEVCQAANFGEPALLAPLLDEADRIARILGAIVVNTKANGL